MSHGIDFTGATAQPRDLGDDPAKLRDEIGRLTQRLVRARASYDSDIVRGSGGTPPEREDTPTRGHAGEPPPPPGGRRGEAQRPNRAPPALRAARRPPAHRPGAAGAGRARRAAA